MIKTVIASLVSACLVGGVALQTLLRDVVAAEQNSRKYTGRILVEHADLKTRKLPLNEISKGLTSTAQKLGLRIKVLEKMGDRFTVFELLEARSDSDVLYAVEKLKGSGLFLNVEADRFVIANSLSRNSFNDPAWPAWFDNLFAPGKTVDLGIQDIILGSKSLSNLGAVNVAVIDTGYAKNQDFPDRYSFEYRVFKDTKGPNAEISNPTSVNLHGTRMQSIYSAKSNNSYGTLGLAEGVNIVPIRVFDDQGAALTLDITKAILLAANQHSQSDFPVVNPSPASVIGLSLGNEFLNPEKGCPVSMQDAVTKAINTGAILVSGAGNDSSQGFQSPADCDGVISVGVAGDSGVKADISNYNPSISTYTVAAETVSGRFNFLPAVLIGSGATFSTARGSSSSTAVVGSLIALAKATKPTLTAAEVAAALKATNVPFSANDPICGSGARCGGGILNPKAFFKAATGQDLVVASTPAPTAAPTASPTAAPTPAPTAEPTASPTAAPTPAPTASPAPAPTGSGFVSAAAFENTRTVSADAAGLVTEIDRDSVVVANRFGGQVANGPTASSSGTLASVIFPANGEFIVRFSGTPLSNTPSNASTSQKRFYAFSVAVNGSRANFTQIQEIVQNGQPTSFAPTPLDTSAPSPSPAPTTGNATGQSGGGGGSTGLFGLFGLIYLIRIFRKAK